MAEHLVAEIEEVAALAAKEGRKVAWVLPRVRLGMVGVHQRYNAAAAVRTLLWLREQVPLHSLCSNDCQASNIAAGLSCSHSRLLSAAACSKFRIKKKSTRGVHWTVVS
jgi:hypothetical protein